MDKALNNEFSMLNRMYRKALIPNIFVILGGTVNVFFDGILVGQRIGELGVAAVNQSLAVYLILCTIGSLISAGAMAEASRAFGMNDQESASRYFSMSIEISVIIGIIIAAAGFFISAPIASLLGTAETNVLVTEYVKITLIGGIFKILIYIPGFFLRLEGKYKSATALTVVMMAGNIILDYIFLFIFDFGIKGAAYASVLSSVIACVFGFLFLLKGKGMFFFRLVKIEKKKLFSIIKSGSPMASNNLLSAVRLIVLNAIMAAAGGSEYLVIFAIANNLNEFSICIQNGVPQTGSTMLGLLFGEKDTISMKYLFRDQVKYGLVYSAVFAAVLCALSGVIGRLFGCDLNIVVPVICLAVSIIPATFNSGLTYYYYAIGNVVMANIINVLRVFAVTCAFALLLAHINVCIWLFFPLGEVFTALIWIIMCKVYSKKQEDKSTFLFLPENGTGHEISLMVSCDAGEICEASERVSRFAEEQEFTIRQCSTLGLAVEELLVIVSEKSLNKKGEMSVRLLKTEEGGILRIRSDGKPYNPLDVMEDDEDMEYMGVRMICKMAKNVDYQSTLGVNTLLVVI